MGKLGGSSLVILGIFLILFGAFIGSNFVSGLLELLRWVFIVIGVVAGGYGVVQMLSGDKSSSSY